MEFLRRSGLCKNSYFLSNLECFFHRFADSGFKNKWTGLWHREHKFMELFAFKEGGKWLSENLCREFLYNGLRASHTFRVNGKTIRQELYFSDSNHMVVELSCEKPMELELMLGVNIRRRSENRTSRQYSAGKKGRILRVANELGSLFVSSNPGLCFEKNPEYMDHYPSGDAQNYFIPGRITLSGKRVRISFSPALGQARPSPLREPERSLQRRERRILGLQKLLRTDNKQLEKGFLWSAIATEHCRKKGPGVIGWYAGLPWFQHFWARDLFWVTPSLTALGYFEDVRKSIEYFAASSRSGRIPNLVSETEGIHMNALDPTPLWMMSLRDYVFSSGDMTFLRSMRRSIESSMRYLLSCDTDGDGYLEHDSQFPETWMDTLKRDTKSIEMQALCCSAFASSLELLSHLRSPDKKLIREIESKTELLTKNMERDFFANGFLADRIFWKQPVPIRTANALVPVILGFRKHSKEIMRAVESRDFTTPVGVRTRAQGEQGYDPGGYHNGSVWSLTTAWASAAEFLARSPEKGWRYLSMMLKDIERDSLGCIGECWNSSSLDLSGCSLQLWGSGFIPRLVDEFMLGIRISSLDRTITVSPNIPKCIKKIQRIRRTGLGQTCLKFMGSGKDVEISCSNRRFRILRET